MERQLRAIVYSRVSTDAQERDGTSLHTQERASHEYVDSNGWILVESIRDTSSGSTLDRPGIERLRTLIRQGSVDVVVAYAVDRLSRSQNHIGVLFDEVDQSDVQLQFVTERFEDTAIGRFILAARAFIGEVEREKIAERTMRGKAERARSGKLPQGTGRGCYGYIYDKNTGTRLVSPTQSIVVKGIFTDFLADGSIISIANRLNESREPTFTGSKWYPVTLHHILRNETYTGRTVYRRTSVSVRRDAKSGKRKRQVTERDPSQWIEIEGASPQIIESEVFEAVQRILDDPERRRRGRRIHDYSLSGRTKCLKCGRAMVGQTLKGRYRYYRCRKAFAGPKHDRCPTVYVRADSLEQSVREEAARLLSNPNMVLAESERLRNEGVNHETLAAQQKQLSSLDARRGRLLKLYEMGEIDDAYFLNESKSIQAEKTKLEECTTLASAIDTLPNIVDLEQACQRVYDWVVSSEGDQFELILKALQIQVRVEDGRGELKGVIPEYTPNKRHADVCAVVISRES